ncbi:MAG: histidine kinase dimerization/phosphoacceptor domain -containing protein [Syntrophales bacterium]|nr:histidine kinase dimerization/phosphoacceptor domain -containing protein [Syntrophales bacterium]
MPERTNLQTIRNVVATKENLAIFLASFVMLGYIVFLLGTNYVAQRDLQDASFKQLKHKLEKRTTAVSNFFHERKDDLKNLSASREISIFFENRALGMSMEYGLEASLLNIFESFDRIMREKKLGDDPIYTRIILADRSGELLVNSQLSKSNQEQKLNRKELLTPERTGPHIVIQHDGSLIEVMVFMPYFFKGNYTGQIISWISPETVYSHLIKSEDSLSEHLFLVDCEKVHFYPVSKIQPEAFSGMPDPCNFVSGKPYIFKSISNGVSRTEMLAVRLPIKNTPFYIVTAIPVSRVFGHTKPQNLLLVMGMAALIILGGNIFVLRSRTRDIVLNTRLDEESKRKREVSEKNLQLEQEIAKRKLTEEELRKYQDHLEEMVKKRTADLIKANDQLQLEITNRKRAEEQIRESLKEKEVLLQEIHHRVKNNMQVISSLLNLQSEYVKDKESLEMFKESRDRIFSMASVHEKLYQSKDLAKIDFDDYIKGITKHLFRNYVVYPNTVRLNVNCSDVFLDINKAVPCGLIINELISNALKHAFPEGREGEIAIDFHPDGDKRLTLVVSDNGVGFPEDIDINDTETLGLRLISILVAQLKGTLEVERDGGTSFKITFAP